MKTENNYSLSAHNTFGIDARCRQFVEYETVDELRILSPADSLMLLQKLPFPCCTSAAEAISSSPLISRVSFCTPPSKAWKLK